MNQIKRQTQFSDVNTKKLRSKLHSHICQSFLISFLATYDEEK